MDNYRYGYDKDKKIRTQKMNKEKVLIFDYGATLDTNGIHWYYVFKQEHLRFNSFLSDEQLREAYVYAERSVSANCSIGAQDNFLKTLLIKVGLQYDWLQNQGIILENMRHTEEIAENCYNYAKSNIENVRGLLRELAIDYRLAIVSNFYGNLEAVLEDFGIRSCFECVVESAALGVSKPDKRLLLHALRQMEVKPDCVAVVGDSYKKDIVPAKQLGCHTVWLKGQGWRSSPIQTPLADQTIEDISQLTKIVVG